MDSRRVVATHLPLATVAALIIVLLDAYTGELTGTISLLSAFLLHLVAIFVGFVVVDVGWRAAFGQRVD